MLGTVLDLVDWWVLETESVWVLKWVWGTEYQLVNLHAMLVLDKVWE